MLLLAAAIFFSFQHVSETLLILLSLVIFLSKRDFIAIFFKSFDFSVDFFAFSTKICLYLSFPQMFMAVRVLQGFQSGPVPGTFTRLRSCIVPAEITEPPPKLGVVKTTSTMVDRLVEYFS
jgi:hypothetical protein